MKLLVSISGLPKTGKTTLAHSFPKPLHLDFARVSMSFRKLQVHKEEYGEGYDPIWKLYNNDKEFNQHYKYVREWKDVYPILEDFKGSTLILDDSYRTRGLCAQNLMKEKKVDFPAQQHWGIITQELDGIITDTKANVVVVNQMFKRIEKTGDSIIQYVEPRYLPSDLPYMADISISLEIRKKDKKTSRIAVVNNNRFLDPTGNEWVNEVEDPTYLKLLALLKVPKRYY